MTIAVVGSINADTIVNCERIPGPGETVPGLRALELPGGKGANQAVAIARLGGRVTIFGSVGADRQGDELVGLLRSDGVETRFVQRVAGIGSGKAIVMTAVGENSIVVIPGANDMTDEEYVRANLDAIMCADVIVLQNEIPMVSNELVIEEAALRGKLVIYNPAPFRPISDDVRSKVSYITPNEHELRLLVPGCGDAASAVAAAPGALIATLGPAGAMYRDPGGRVVRVPGAPAERCDTTGAGDTFNGALAFALASGSSLPDSIRFANAAAACSIESQGAQSGMPSLSQVTARLRLAV